MGELLGYARVSTTVQDAALQLDALSAAGCWRTWTDTASGAKTDRPQLAEVMASVRPGDTLVVWRLDRLGRSLPHLVETVRQARRMLAEGATKDEVAGVVGVSISTLYRRLSRSDARPVSEQDRV
jgi:DNA invertase Pin-like site-specific DNA recombinase